MSVRLLLTCGGCRATVNVGPLRRRFHSVSGTNSGWGSFRVDDPESLTPDGWMMFDPYTQATYCPECWAGLLAGFAEDDAKREAE